MLEPMPDQTSDRRGTRGRLVGAMTRAALAALAACIAHAPALASAIGAPPPPALRRSAPVWLGYLIIFALLAMVVIVSLIPSKRGHQD
jgi:hypothetical protein